MVACMAIAMAAAAFGQSEGPLRFEVASVKPVPPRSDGRYMVRMRVDASRLDITSFSLKALIRSACEVQEFQISGPDWMASTRFDIAANLPAGTTRSQVPEMLRSLLAERFKMKIHRETRELPVYALVVGKNGPQMKEAQVDPDAPGSGAAGQSPVTAGSTVAGVDCGATNETPVAAGWMINKGPNHVEGHAMNMVSLANTLAFTHGYRVIDQTGLKGNYDFDLNYTPDEGQRTPETIVASLLDAVQSKLGLKLEGRKGPVELIVVDHIEKTPTEN
jgi:uncharacterized protein (TIGR03435 family)